MRNVENIQKRLTVTVDILRSELFIEYTVSRRSSLL